MSSKRRPNNCHAATARSACGLCRACEEHTKTHKVEGARRKRCSSCKQLKHDVTKTVNPYVEDVQGLKIKDNICGECHQAMVSDI